MESVQFAGVPVQLHSDDKSHTDIVKDIVQCLKQKDQEDAFYLADLGDIVAKYHRWTEYLPRVQPFYAVKCNPDPLVLKLLAHLGIGFDCASKVEIDSILDLRVDPSRIVYAHPCKHNSYIRYAAKRGVDLMTFDNEEELVKVKANFPDARLVLRITPPANFKVSFPLGEKFGCRPEHASSLLRKARQLNLNVVGVSFHVGSGVEEPQAFHAAIQTAARVFEEGEALGFHFTLLDIGGGSPSTPAIFTQVANVVNKSLEEYFPPQRKVKVIAEPGRYFVDTAFSLTANIIAKRTLTAAHPHANPSSTKNRVNNGVAPDVFMYYINDGVYGSFNRRLLPGSSEETFRLIHTPDNSSEYKSIIWGPSCDQLDVVRREVDLPELHVGDFINVCQMGDYTLGLITNFNGMPRPLIFYHCARRIWAETFSEDQED